MRRLIIGLAALVVLAGVGQAWGAIAGNTLVVPEPSAFTLLAQVPHFSPRNPLFSRVGGGIFPLHLGFNF